MTKQKDSAEKAIRDIRRVTRRQYSAEEKIRIVLDGVRKSIQNWREVLLRLKLRGMNPPKLGVGDGAMGFWAA